MKKIGKVFIACMALGMMSAALVACGDKTGGKDSGASNSSQTSVDTSSGDSSASDSGNSSDTIKSNSISEITYTGDIYCGMEIPTVTATAEYGEVVYAYAEAQGNTSKEELTYRTKEEILGWNPNFKLTEGTYYVRASVEETEEYEGAVKYASLTVTHSAYEKITEVEEVIAPTYNTQGYSVKHCGCGMEMRGDYTVFVSVSINNEWLPDFAVPVGGKLDLGLELPTRSGYTLQFLDGHAEVWDFETATFTETTYLTGCWIVTETGYNYLLDAVNLIASFPRVDASNAEDLLQMIEKIDKIIAEHYTEEEKKASHVARFEELKAEVEAYVNTIAYQLEKRLLPIPEFAEMTDEAATLRAVLSYVQYVNSLSETELGDYTEPRKITLYKGYFSCTQTLVKGLNAAVETNGHKNAETGDIVLDGAENNEYVISFPKIPYALLTGAKVIAYMGEANKATGYTFKAYDTTLVNAFNGSWFWIEVLVEGGNYYLSIYDTDSVSGTKVALPQAVVNGEESLSFTVATAGVWDWMKFRQDGGVSEDNFVGDLKAFADAKAVYTASFTYYTSDGEQTITQYYLAGEKLVAPYVDAHTYTDKVGTHTFAGFGELADTVTENLAVTAVYETAYKNYAVIFLDADYNVFGEVKEDYHYGDKVVLPETTPEKAKEGDWSFEFIGWFDGENQITEETLVEKNMEVEPRFKQVYEGEYYLLTIEGEGVETQQYQVPVVANLQAEALAAISVPVRNNYDFIGYVNKENGEAVDLQNLAVNADMVLAISWQATYISKAAALPASVADITDEAQTYADLVAYIAHVSCDYTAEDLSDYEDPANVTALKNYFAGVRKIYTFTTIDDNNISTSERFENVGGYGEAWFQDNHGNAYGGYIQATFDLKDGVGSVTLPKIAYGAYKEVSFGLSCLSTGAASLSVNGSAQEKLAENEQQLFYTVVIANGVLTVHAMNEPALVKLTVALTAEQMRGNAALTLSVEENGWSCLWISHIHGELKDEVVAQENMAAALLAKLPQSVADITNEAQTYQDLVAYLSYVANNPQDGYVEPANVTALRAHFVGKKVVVSGVMTSVTTNAGYETANGLVLSGASENTYTFELPTVNYAIYDRVSFITVFGQANSGYTFAAYGMTFVNTSTTWNWVHVIKVGAEGKAVRDTNTGADILLTEGYYLTIGNTDVGEEWYKYIKIPEAVIRGEEGLTFSVTTSEGSWDWMKIRQDGGVEADNLAGTLA